MHNFETIQKPVYRRMPLAHALSATLIAIMLSTCMGAGIAFAETTDTSTNAVASTDTKQQVASTAASTSITATTNEINSDQTTADQLTDAQTTADQLTDTQTTAGTSANTQTTSENTSEGTLAQDSAVKDASGNTIEAFDLRKATTDTDGTLTSKSTYNEGDKQSTIEDGTNYVTPVKAQNPWGSCWAFSSTAASETSILTALDEADDGIMNGSISYDIAHTWAALDEADDGIMNGSIDYGSVSVNLALLAEYASDLSERHLAYYSFYNVSADSIYPDQEGEGKHLIDTSNSDAAIFDAGGMPWLALSEYSSGIGPVPEWMAPYMNDEGYYQVPTDQLNDERTNFVYKNFSSYEEAKSYSESLWTPDRIAKFNEDNGTSITAASVVPRKAVAGTWSLDGSDVYVVVAELTNSNVIDQDLNKSGLSTQEVILMKQELLNGRPISIGFKADQSKPGQTLTGNTYMNTSTWAQYTFENVQMNHAVTIVGYDDNYDASNFTHTIYTKDKDGNLVKDEAATLKTTPAGNGAWIVKNSWGSLDASDPAEVVNWGINGSGYFYLSYYDKTINVMESYEYDVSAEAQERSFYLAYQHDLANVASYTATKTNSASKMCNVFEGPEQGEGSISIRDLGFVTGAAGDTATLEVYVLNDADDVVTTIENGQPVVKISATFDCSGFHRIHLDSAIKVLPNQKFAVVQTNTCADGSYEYVSMNSAGQEFVEAYNAAMQPLTQNPISYYLKTVINRGESFIAINGGSWEDWVDASAEIDATKLDAEIEEVRAKATQYRQYAAMYRILGQEAMAATLDQVASNCENFTVKSVYAYDNFSIKAYADDSSVAISQTLSATAERAYTFDSNAHSPQVTVSMGSTVLTEGVDYLLSGDLEETEVGTYVITITGIGEYTGTTTVTWKIVPQEAPIDNPSNHSGGTIFIDYELNTTTPLPQTSDNATTAFEFAGMFVMLSMGLVFVARRRIREMQD